MGLLAWFLIGLTISFAVGLVSKNGNARRQ
jgi:hypothetical protein